MISMPRLHHQLQLVSCYLRMRVEESKAQVTITYFSWTSKKAFLNGKISGNVYIELPAEDLVSEDGALGRKTGQCYVLHERCSS